MADVQTKFACACCAEPVGEPSPVLAHTIREDAGDGAGKAEHFCPQCFVWVRAKEDSRWDRDFHLQLLVAIACHGCGKQSVSFSGPRCGQCGSRAVTILPPKRGQMAPLEQVAKAAGIAPDVVKAARKIAAKLS